MPFGSPELTAPQVVMVNLLGGDDGDLYERLHHVLAADPEIRVHLYGKQARPGRKIGHVTALGDDVAGPRDRALAAASYLRWGTTQEADLPDPPLISGASLVPAREAS